jgi:hypothetical protein
MKEPCHALPSVAARFARSGFASPPTGRNGCARFLEKATTEHLTRSRVGRMLRDMEATRKERLARAIHDVHTALKEEKRARDRRGGQRWLLDRAARDRLRNAIVHFADVIGSDE